MPTRLIDIIVAGYFGTFASLVFPILTMLYSRSDVDFALG